jgi:hypothetical protein
MKKSEAFGLDTEDKAMELEEVLHLIERPEPEGRSGETR